MYTCVSIHVCVSTPTDMYCILIDAHLSDGDQLMMHDVFPLRGVESTAQYQARRLVRRWGGSGNNEGGTN